VHSFGGVIERHHMYDIHQVYSLSSSSVPIVLLLPCFPVDNQPPELSSITGLYCCLDDGHVGSLLCCRLFLAGYCMCQPAVCGRVVLLASQHLQCESKKTNDIFCY